VLEVLLAGMGMSERIVEACRLGAAHGDPVIGIAALNRFWI
jgi:hypothetical protein